MLVRMKIRGAGTPEDPYQVPFPTYNMVEHNTNSGWAIVEIPDNAAPDDLLIEGGNNGIIHNGKPVLIKLTPAQTVKWGGKVRGMYGKTHGDFDGDVMP